MSNHDSTRRRSRARNGDYNSYGSTQSCTVYNTQYDDLVLAAYHEYSAAAGYAEHAYP